MGSGWKRHYSNSVLSYDRALSRSHDGNDDDFNDDTYSTDVPTLLPQTDVPGRSLSPDECDDRSARRSWGPPDGEIPPTGVSRTLLLTTV